MELMVLAFVAANSFAASAPTSNCTKIVALSAVAFLQTFQIIGYEKLLIVALDWLHSRRDLVLCRVFLRFGNLQRSELSFISHFHFHSDMTVNGKHPKGSITLTLSLPNAELASFARLRPCITLVVTSSWGVPALSLESARRSLFIAVQEKKGHTKHIVWKYMSVKKNLGNQI